MARLLPYSAAPVARLLMLATVAAVVSTAGCANPKREAVVAALAELRSPPLQRIESSEQLRVALAARQKLDAAHDAYGRWYLCLDGPKSGAPRRACETRSRQHQDDDATRLDRIEVTGSRIAMTDLITNNQVASVDEGDIVKKLGDFIVVLREGRIYTVRTDLRGAATLEIVASMDVLPDVSENDIWFDEILAFPGGLFLLGYNYRVGASELILFDLGADGSLRRGARFQIDSMDYYSGGNYGSRMVGENLITIISAPLSQDGGLPMPRWRSIGADPRDWQPLAQTKNFFLPLGIAEELVANIVLRCPLDQLLAGRFDCDASAIVGDVASEHYITENAAYLAISGWDPSVYLDPEFSTWRYGRHDDPTVRHESKLMTAVYQIPFDRLDRPRVARLLGDIPDQFAFHESGGRLMVATHARLKGDRMWTRLFEIDWDGSQAVLEVPARQFADLEHPMGYDTYRFTERVLWVGSDDDHWAGRELTPGLVLYAQPLSGGPAGSIPVEHTVDRIEVMGSKVFISGVGPSREWRASLAWHDGRARRSESVPIVGFASAEHRSHAFNAIRAHDRVFAALPGWRLTEEEMRDIDSAWYDERVADLVMLEVAGDALVPRGAISMQEFSGVDEECNVSCVDWYGNARAFAANGRIFALSSHGFVEAVPEAGGFRTVRSVRLTR